MKGSRAVTIRRPIVGLFTISLGLLLVSQVIMALYAWNLFERDTLPSLDRKATTVAVSVQAEIVHALDIGIPYNDLVGMDELFSQVLDATQGLAFVALTSSAGEILHIHGIDRKLLGSMLAETSKAALTRFNEAVEADPATHIVTQSFDKVPDSITKLAFTDTAIPLAHNGQALGVLHVAVDQSFIQDRISEIRLDIGTVLLTSILIALEFLLFVVTLSLLGPARMISSLLNNIAQGDFRHVILAKYREELGCVIERLTGIVNNINTSYAEVVNLANKARASTRSAAIVAQVDKILAKIRECGSFPSAGGVTSYRQPRVISIRMLTFLFMFAELLSRPFLPLYVRELVTPLPGISEDILIGLPISAFMLMVALSMPIAGGWSGRVGHVKAYTTGALLATIGLLGTGLAFNLWDLILWRSLSGIGYATMFMACQGFTIDNTDEQDRTRGIASFVGAIMLAEICAPAIGGILADRVGYTLVFVFAAVVAMSSSLLAVRIIHSRTSASPHQNCRLRATDFGQLLHNFRFVILTLFAGIPTKMLLTGYLVYLVPVYLTELGSSPSDIGRTVMIYGICTMVLGPLFARLADRFRCHGLMVGLGGLISGAGLLPVMLWPGVDSVLLGVAAIGIGQAMSISPQLVLVSQVCRDHIQDRGHAIVLGIFRLIERIGAALGPVLVGVLSAVYGFVYAMAISGAIAFIASLIFSVAFLILGLRSEDELNDFLIMESSQ